MSTPYEPPENIADIDLTDFLSAIRQRLVDAYGPSDRDVYTLQQVIDLLEPADAEPLDQDHLYEDMFTRQGVPPDDPDMHAARSVDRMFR